MRVEDKRSIRSRGVPSIFTLYLPPYNSPELRRFQDDSENQTRNLWSLEEVLEFVFPKKFQERYNKAALLFLRELEKNGGEMDGTGIASMIKSENISKSTFYNRVLPKLKRFGLVKVGRIAGDPKSSKHRMMVVRLSKTFGNYLGKISDSWLAFIDDVRSRR